MSVCLQINLAPLDAPHAIHTVPHQMRVLGGQVDEVQFTLDLHHSEGSRYRTANFEEKLAAVRGLLDRVISTSKHASVLEVDYAPPMMREGADFFIKDKTIPMKAENGSPFYPYFYGLYRAKSDHVFHLDSDMLFGGGSQTWVAEAVQILSRRREIVACNPLSGPPTRDGRLKTQVGLREAADPPAYRFNTLSTRLFMLDRRRFFQDNIKLSLCRPDPLRLILSTLSNNPPYLAAEDTFSRFMKANGYYRLDFLGSGNGLWSLHPVYRSETFYKELPNLIDRIERGDVPDEQRGDYNLNDSMIDWSDVRARLTMRKRLAKHLTYATVGVAGRLRSLLGR